MLRYFLTLFAVICVAFIGVAGWQGKKSKDTPVIIFDDMDYQAKYKPLGESTFAGFADGRMARPPVAGTVARGSINEPGVVFSPEYKAAAVTNTEFSTGKDASGKFIDGFPKNSLHASADGKGLAPYALDSKVLDLGKRKFEIYCAVCHGPAADGNGIMKKRGEVQEGEEAIAAIQNLQGETFRKYPNGQIFDAITNGAGAKTSFGTLSMPANADKLTAEERWAVVAYLRALQLSQNCPEGLVPVGVDKTKLK